VGTQPPTHQLTNAPLYSPTRNQPTKPPTQDFLTRWRTEREMNQAMLQEHSTWLRGFKEQLSASGKVPATAAAAAVR